MKFIALLFVCLVFAGCTPSPVAPVVDASDADVVIVTVTDAGTPSVVPDAVAPPQPQDACSQACANLSDAGCPEGSPTCASVCRTIQGAPTFAYAFPLSCLQSAKGSAAIKKCGVACLGK